MTIFRNRMAWVLWIFMAVWMFFLASMTYVLLRDGSPPGYSRPLLCAVLSVFWAAGLGASAWAGRQRIVRVDLAESHDHASIEAVAARFNAVAGRRRGPRPQPASP
jgi:hypothetical protein